MTSEKLRNIAKITGIYLGIFTALWIFFVVAKLWLLYDVYSFLVSLTTKITGLDQVIIRPMAVLFTVFTILALPCIAAFVFYGGKKLQVMTITLLATTLYTAATFYSTNNVFFDRTTGKAVKYYIRTLNGYKFSSTGDYDPVLGVKYKIMTREAIKEFQLWQQTGKLGEQPTVKEGQYFDTVTGEPITWYSTRPNGEVVFFPLPGYDPLTGEALKPITKDVIFSKKSITSFEEEQFVKYVESGDYYNTHINTVMGWCLNYRGVKIKAEEKVIPERCRYRMEKLIFTPRHTVVCLYAKPEIPYSERSTAIKFKFQYDATLIDIYGQYHKSTNTITSGNWDISRESITPLDEARVLYIFPSMEKGLLKKGVFGEGINFTIDE